MAISRWIERQLPRAKRRDSSPRLIINWADPSFATRWEGIESQPFSFFNLVLDCLKVDGGLPSAAAEVFAQRIVGGVRQGTLSLPRLVRLDESDQARAVLRLQSRDDRTVEKQFQNASYRRDREVYPNRNSSLFTRIIQRSNPPGESSRKKLS